MVTIKATSCQQFSNERYRKLPKVAKISQKWPPEAKAPKICQSGQKFIKVAKKMLKFGKIAKRYQKLPKVAKISQKWPPKAKAPKSCQRMPKFAQNCQNLQNVPKVAKRCQNMPEVDKSC